MSDEKIKAKLNYLELRIQSLEKSWRAEKFKAEQEITKRWRKKEQLRQKRLTINVERNGSEYRLSGLIKDATKWSDLIHKGFLYRVGELWYVRKTIAEDAGYLVLEV